MCLLVIFVVVAFDVLAIQPFSDKTLISTARYLSTGESLLVMDQPWFVYPVGVFIHTPGIYTISFVDQTLIPQSENILDNIKVYMTWTNSEGHVHNLTCPVTASTSFQCPSISKNEWSSVISGELFIGANFTAIVLALKDNGQSEKDLSRHAQFVLIQLGYGIIDTLGNAFPLLPDVHLRATLAVTHRQALANTGITALGFQKVGCDAQMIFKRR